MTLSYLALLIALSAFGGFVAGRAHGLELAARRIIRAYEDL